MKFRKRDGGETRNRIRRKKGEQGGEEEENKEEKKEEEERMTCLIDEDISKERLPPHMLIRDEARCPGELGNLGIFTREI